MSLESIIEHILDEAKAQKENIIQQARQEKNKAIQQAQKEADRLYQEILDKENDFSQKEKQGLIVNAYLESKKDLLKAKQELIDSVFGKLKANFIADKFKKQLIFPDKMQIVPEDMNFYLNKLRNDYEIEIAKTLFV